jgi:hypothetical protein
VVTGTANWRIPPEYQVADVSSTIVKIVLGHLELRRGARAGANDKAAQAL